ncbi:hypothetical protein [Synechococcus sp. M16CYN]|uniref:hypothetical protein n=1 Tax=Synechococcus sp. M16CYN TaxID=3103139 RepID=UPI003340D83D
MASMRKYIKPASIAALVVFRDCCLVVGNLIVFGSLPSFRGWVTVLLTTAYLEVPIAPAFYLTALRRS